MQHVSEVAVQQPWITRYCKSGSVIIKGLASDGTLDGKAPDQRIENVIPNIDTHELRVSSNEDISQKIWRISRQKEDLLSTENFLDQAWFIRGEGEEIAFYEGMEGGHYGPWDQNTKPTPWDDNWYTVVDWIVCQITQSHEDWMKHYLILYHVVRS